jgi:hypothetical protein
MNDPLAQYRRVPKAVSPVTPPPVAPQPEATASGYIAFGLRENPNRLYIRKAQRAERSPLYGSLLDVVFDADKGLDIVLIYSFLIVTVTGRNLRDLAVAIAERTVGHIQEFDPAKWPHPTDEKAAFIESIDLMKQGGVASEDDTSAPSD